MGSIFSCEDDDFVIDPEMNPQFDKSFVGNFTDNQVYLDINKIFPQFPRIEMLENSFYDRYSLQHAKNHTFFILKTVLEAPAQAGYEILSNWEEKKNSFYHPNLFVVHSNFLCV
jgi:hypothetical protein